MNTNYLNPSPFCQKMAVSFPCIQLISPEKYTCYSKNKTMLPFFSP